MAGRFRWQEEPAFLARWQYEEGHGPEDHHPSQWPKLAVHRYGRLVERRTDVPWFAVAVHSTERSRDGWTYNVAELKGRPIWVAYFHHASGQRVEHARSPEAGALAEAFDLHRML